MMYVIVGRVFGNVDLDEPIRYAIGDPIESWLHKLLCLDVANYIPNIDGRCEYKFLYFNIRIYYK